MAGVSDATLAVALKEVFVKRHDLTKFLYKNSPIIGMIPKKMFGGSTLTVPFKVGESKGIGRDFANLYTDVTTNDRGQTFVEQKLDVDKYFAVWSLDIDQKLRSEKVGQYAFIDLQASEMRSVGHSIALTRVNHFWGDGRGTVAQVGTGGTAGSTFILANPADQRYFLGVGLKFNVASANHGALITGTGGATAVYTVTKIDEATGEITYTKDNGGSDIVNTHNIYLVGDWRSSSSVGAGRLNVMAGLENYAPATPSSNLYGLDQTTNPARLTGLRLAKAQVGSSLTMSKDILLRALARQRRTQAGCKYLACNAETFTDIVLELGASVRYDRMAVKSSDKAVIGFDGLKFVGPGFSPMLTEENVIKNKVVWGLNPRDFEICSMRRFINPWNFDGKIIDRVLGQDRIYGAINSRAQLKAREVKNLLRVDVTK